jgi:succinate dehydrogenase hydrophobic anchor subunit
MAQRKTVSGTRSCWLWTITGLILVVIIVFGALIFLVLPLVRGQVEAGQHYAACVNFLNSGDCDQAAVECQAVVRLDTYSYYPNAGDLLTV